MVERLLDTLKKSQDTSEKPQVTSIIVKESVKSEIISPENSKLSASITHRLPINPDDVSSNESKIELSKEQEQVLELAKTGKSFFFTGPAGTGTWTFSLRTKISGKSFILQILVRELREKYGSSRVYVTAPTGIAACNIGGCTIHSFAAIGLGDQPVNGNINNEWSI